LIGFCCCAVLAAIGAIAPPSIFVELALVGAVHRPALLLLHVAAISAHAPTSETLDQISGLVILNVPMDLVPPAIQRLPPAEIFQPLMLSHDERQNRCRFEGVHILFLYTFVPNRLFRAAQLQAAARRLPSRVRSVDIVTGVVFAELCRFIASDFWRSIGAAPVGKAPAVAGAKWALRRHDRGRSAGRRLAPMVGADPFHLSRARSSHIT
jgi:hypothetical protein